MLGQGSDFLSPSPIGQSLKLIPVPRELRLSSTQALNSGLQITCAAPCAPEDAFAIEDLKAYLVSLNIPVNDTSPVNILVTRYGPPSSKAIYTASLPASSTPASSFRPACRWRELNEREFKKRWARARRWIW